MPVPWEAFIPCALLITMFGTAGTLLNLSKRTQNDGKPPRYGLDGWEEMMMQRDRRLTGTIRGQTTEIAAPKAFSTNSQWMAERL